jgi:hypothetical protein
MSSEDGVYPKRSRTGVYDQIVCETCERVFSPWDDYAQQFLTGDLHPSYYVIDQGEKLALILPEVDYVRLKLFFLSVLWRASVSTQALFAKVRLGPHEPILRHMISQGNPGEPDEYSVTLAKFDSPVHQVGIINPERTKFGVTNCYRLYVYGYIAVVKVDQRATIDAFQDMILRPNKPLCVVLRNFKSSREYAAMVRAVRQNTVFRALTDKYKRV